MTVPVDQAERLIANAPPGDFNSPAKKKRISIREMKIDTETGMTRDMLERITESEPT